jgi:hypothetical protein
MKQPKVSIQGSIVQQREMLTGLLYEPLNQLADAGRCGAIARREDGGRIERSVSLCTLLQASICAEHERDTDNFQHKLRWAGCGAFRTEPVRPTLHERGTAGH